MTKRETGVCQIKAEYIVAQKKEIKEDKHEEAADKVEDARDAREKNGHREDRRGDKKGKRRRERRGQNKKRKREDLGLSKRLPDAERMCPFVTKDVPCEFKDCKYQHDVKKYLLTKPKLDTTEECLFFDNYGSCPYGFTCLYDSKHTTVIDGEPKQVKVDQGVELVKMNELGLDLKRALRKRTYKFNYHGALADKERKKISFKDKVYVAPLTTVGNLPFRRVLKGFGADITCGEMAMARNLLSTKASEWALVRRHPSEDIFGVQLADSDPRVLEKCVTMLGNETQIDFIDLNVGCPIELVTDYGAGSSLMNRPTKLGEIVKRMTDATKGNLPIGVKMRMGWNTNKPNAHKLVELAQSWKHEFKHGSALAYVAIHGRSRQQRYTKVSRWDYIRNCCAVASAAAYNISPTFEPTPILGNGDIMSYTEYEAHMVKSLSWKAELESNEFDNAKLLAGNEGKADSECFALTGCMLARGALIKPWLCTEIKERRHWDISSSERFEMLKDYTRFGLENWGTDKRGLDNTRRFLLEWMSFLHRYVPVGLIEAQYVPQMINDRPQRFVGRDDLETLMGSTAVSDWIKISEMLLGPVAEDFKFQPKHKANSFAKNVEQLAS